MKKLILSALISLGAITASGQKGLNDNYFGMFEYVDNPEIDCSNGRHDALVVQRCMARDFIKQDKKRGIDLTTYTYVKPDNTSGLYNKVARGAAAQRPRSSSSAKYSSTRKVGSYNYNTSDEHINWMRNRQEQIRAAREEAERRKRWEEMQRRIADDNRAAAVTAQTNAALQAQTNARIARDNWHATEGAALAQQRARQAMVKQGPQFDKMKPQSTGSQQASRLRGTNKPRRTMTYNPQPRNTARRVLPQVQRKKQVLSAREQQLRQKQMQQALEMRKKRQIQARQLAVNVAKMELQSRPQPSRILISQKKSKGWNSGKPLVLSEHATSTLGKDWNTESLTPKYAPSTKRKMTAEERHNLIVIEMIDQRPLTPAEEKYYENLTL